MKKSCRFQLNFSNEEIQRSIKIQDDAHSLSCFTTISIPLHCGRGGVQFVSIKMDAQIVKRNIPPRKHPKERIESSLFFSVQQTN